MALPAQKIPRPFDARIIRGGKYKDVRLDINNPGDRFKWAMNQDLRPGPGYLLCLLATEYFNVERRDAYPTVRTMSELTGFCRDTIFSHLKTLKDRGLITPVGKADWGAVVYRVNIGPVKVKVKEIQEAPEPEEIQETGPKEGIDSLAHWRLAYDSGADLRGMPLQIASQIFEEDRAELRKNANLPLENQYPPTPPPIGVFRYPPSENLDTPPSENLDRNRKEKQKREQNPPKGAAVAAAPFPTNHPINP